MRQFVIALFNTSIVTGICIFIFLLIFSFCGKMYAAKSRKIIWCLIAVFCLVPFRSPAVWLGYSVDIPDVVIRQGDMDHAERTVTQGKLAAEPQQTASVKNPETGNFAVSGITGKEITTTDVFFSLWICVAAALLLYYSAGYWRLKGKIERLGYECTNSDVRKILQEELERYQLKKAPRLWILRDSPMGPFAMGVLQNRIVLPDDISDERELRFILRHEILHCKKRDTLWKLFFLFVNIIHWFNPLVWLLRKAAEQDIEICCDEAVVFGTNRAYRKEYSDVLMSQIARNSYKWSAASTGYAQEVKFIKRRFDSIMNGRKKKGVFLIAAACVILLLAGSLIHIQNGEKVYAMNQDPVGTGMESKSAAGEKMNQSIRISSEDAAYDLSNAAEFNPAAEDNAENSQETKEMEEQLLSAQGSEEVQNLRQRMEDFCQAYFNGDAETVKGFLSASYGYDIDVYGNPEEVENMDIRDITGLAGISGLSDTEKYALSKPFIVPGEDSLTYLSVIFVIENGEWKVSFYGLEK